MEICIHTHTHAHTHTYTHAHTHMHTHMHSHTDTHTHTHTHTSTHTHTHRHALRSVCVIYGYYDVCLLSLHQWLTAVIWQWLPMVTTISLEPHLGLLCPMSAWMDTGWWAWQRGCVKRMVHGLERHQAVISSPHHRQQWVRA